MIVADRACSYLLVQYASAFLAMSMDGRAPCFPERELQALQTIVRLCDLGSEFG